MDIYDEDDNVDSWSLATPFFILFWPCINPVLIIIIGEEEREQFHAFQTTSTTVFSSWTTWNQFKYEFNYCVLSKQASIGYLDDDLARQGCQMLARVAPYRLRRCWRKRWRRGNIFHSIWIDLRRCRPRCKSLLEWVGVPSFRLQAS